MNYAHTAARHIEKEGPKISNNFQHLLTSANKGSNQIHCNLKCRQHVPAHPFNNPLVCTVSRP
jgi:hypothetical protein